MGINYKESQGQAERAVVLRKEDVNIDTVIISVRSIRYRYEFGVSIHRVISW
jgi:hypothetical protein